VRITIEKDRQQTKPLLNSGKNPKWKEMLRFKLNSQQLSKADQITINFEAYDMQSDTAESFIGKSFHQLAKVKNKPLHSVNLDIMDRAGKQIGTLALEFELRGEIESPQKTASLIKGSQKGRHVGTVIVKPLSG
jgi:N-acyl-D-aspartate/D-glutamate deacylase